MGRVTTRPKTSISSWARQRVHREHRLGLRLTLACVAAFLILVPFTALLSLVETKWSPLRHLDDDATRSLNDYMVHHEALVHPLRATSYVFHAWVFRLIITGLAIWLFYRGAKRLAVWATVTLIAAGVLDVVLKVLVDRPRPELHSPIAHAPGGSFPSGHALTAAMGCAVIVLMLLPVLSRAWRVTAWIAATVITIAAGICRVALGVHYVSDVLAGWILGVAIVVATVAGFETWRRAEGREPVSPALEGVEPEAAPEISSRDNPAKAPDRI